MSEDIEKNTDNWKQVLLDAGIHSSHPANSPLTMMFECLNTSREKARKQASDSWHVLMPEKSLVLSEIFQYQQYPTAQVYIRALQCFITGQDILENYGKESIDTLDDCQALQPAFHSFVYGHMYENSLFEEKIKGQASSLVEQYLKIRPDDFMVEYLKYIMIYRSSYTIQDISDYEQNKLLIRTGEKMAHKLKSLKAESTDRLAVLIDLYYLLASRYVLTKQPERALDSFEKCYKLDKANYSALYGVAYHYMKNDPEKAKTLFKEYLKNAPACDKQYPNAYYMLASMYLNEKNDQEALRYCDLAEKSESVRLPFLQPVNLPQKQRLQLVKETEKLKRVRQTVMK